MLKNIRKGMKKQDERKRWYFSSDDREKLRFPWARAAIGIGGILSVMGGVCAWSDTCRQTAFDRYNILTSRSGHLDDVRYSLDPEIMQARDRVVPIPGNDVWPMLSFETPENMPSEYVERAIDTMCSVENDWVGDLGEYRMALVQSILWASVTKPESLQDFELQLTPEETFDYLLTLSFAESHAGAELLPEDTEKVRGHYNFAGPYHMHRVLFTQLMKRHGPPSLARHIVVDEEGSPHIIDADGLGRDGILRDFILNLRYDPYVSTMMALANMYESTDNLRHRLEGDFPDIQIREYSLFTDWMHGNDVAEVILRAHLRPKGQGADDAINMEVIEANSSLFYRDDELLDLSELFTSFRQRYDERREASQTLYTHCRNGFSEERRQELREMIWAYPALKHNRLHPDVVRLEYGELPIDDNVYSGSASPASPSR